MILTVDIGNSNIRFGYFDGDRITGEFTLSSRNYRTTDEMTLAIRMFTEQTGLRNVKLEGASLSSVVPKLTEKVGSAIDTLYGCRPVVVGHGVKTGLDIRTDNQSEVGADIVSNAVGAGTLFAPPYIIIDLGTATTVSLVDKDNCLRGVAILPGVKTSLRTLSENCANLTEIDLEATGEKNLGILGKNTPDSISCGILYGFSSMIDGVISKIRDEYGLDRNVTAVACGGSAEYIIPFCNEKIISRRDLTLRGLHRIWELNKK